MKKAIYAFSGDPITFGHINIIERAAKVFYEVVVAIGSNPDKKYMFTLYERLLMAEKVLEHLPNVDVISFEGLLVDYCYEHNISTVIKGIRNSTDFEYENILHQVGESQNNGIDTFLLLAKPELSHVSSSTVKSIKKEQGFVHNYVPLFVKEQLEKKMLDQNIIGITGSIGSGKSYITSKLIDTIKTEYNIDCHNIDLDKIGHDILENLTEPRYFKIRDEILSYFTKINPYVLNDNGSINRKELGQIVFNNKEHLEKLNSIMKEPMLVRIKREMYNKKGILFLNGALLAESNLLHLCNNNVILIYCDKETQVKRLLSRRLDKSQIERRIKSQFSYVQKRNIIQNQINKDNYGKIIDFDSSNCIATSFDNFVKEIL